MKVQRELTLDFFFLGGVFYKHKAISLFAWYSSMNLVFIPNLNI